MISAIIFLASQDLFERDRALRLRLSPDVAFEEVTPQKSSTDLSAEADFACGGFDLKTSFQSLFRKNMKEEFLEGALGTLQRELATSPLVLACYASPTVCDALKHYRVSAQAMLDMDLDSCRAVEQTLDGVRSRSRARAMKECLDEQARKGIPLDQALEGCRRATTLPGLDGRPVREIDLVKDLGLSEDLVPGLRVGAGTLRAEARATAVVEAYESRRLECRDAWGKAVREPAVAELDKLGPVTRPEVERIALMEPGRREAVVASLSSATALSGLVEEVHGIERTLESAELLASSEIRVELERRRAQVRNEIGRLVETFEMERRLNAAVGEARNAAGADVAERAGERLAERRVREAAGAAGETLKPWGCEVRKSERRGP